MRVVRGSNTFPSAYRTATPGTYMRRASLEFNKSSARVIVVHIGKSVFPVYIFICTPRAGLETRLSRRLGAFLRRRVARCLAALERGLRGLRLPPPRTRALLNGQLFIGSSSKVKAFFTKRQTPFSPSCASWPAHLCPDNRGVDFYGRALFRLPFNHRTPFFSFFTNFQLHIALNVEDFDSPSTRLESQR